MGDISGSKWMEYLSPVECWQLLAASSVGRLGVLVDGAPEIYPVNHVVDGETIVFRTNSGNKLLGLDRSPSVCFEVDDLDVEDQTGWSVLVKGRAHEITVDGELRRAAELPLRFWAVGDMAHWIRVESVEVTGRRIHRS